MEHHFSISCQLRSLQFRYATAVQGANVQNVYKCIRSTRSSLTPRIPDQIHFQ
jgi:hypothetical protein